MYVTAAIWYKNQQTTHGCNPLRTKCCLLALDIAGAFDNAWHPGILARLLELKCPTNIYSIVKDFLQDRNAHIRLGDAASSKRVTRGCPQGSVSGPTLCNKIISDLIVLLGTAVAQWLRCCATNQEVAGSIPAGVTGIFH